MTIDFEGPNARRERWQRALEVARQAGAECLATANPATVTWLTGFARSVETGSDPYAIAPVAFLADGEPARVLCSVEDVGGIESLGCVAVPCGGLTIASIDRVGRFVAELEAAVQGRRVATEIAFSSAALPAASRIIDVSEGLARLRLIKSEDEVQLLRELVRVCDAGQAAVRARLVPGVTELELWAAAQQAMEARARTRLTIVADVLSGARTSGVSGDPTEREVQPGEPVISDLLPRLHGYWGDSTSTIACDPRPELRRAWRKVADILDQLVLAVRPGVRAGDLDAIGREPLRYPHHTGHGIGTTYHEEPRLVPGSRVMLEAGMVIALEPALYSANFGVRLEQVVLVEKDGAAVLSGHSLAL